MGALVCDQGAIHGQNASMIYMDSLISGYVEYACVTGYGHIDGSLRRECNRTLQWTGSTPVCKRQFEIKLYIACKWTEYRPMFARAKGQIIK